MDSNNDNITFSIDFLSDDNFNPNPFSKDIDENDINISSISIENSENNNDFIVFDYLNYSKNYTVKELMLICEFYNIAKELKTKKANKETIINEIQIYESDSANYEIVAKRHNFWFYMKELKNDKFMRKYVVW
jgi:hypothetical protein